MQIKKQSIRQGLWMSEGKNPFWVRVIDNQVFWLGMNNKTSEKAPGAEWCHVGYGQLSENQLILHWADVPVGTDELYGTVTIEVVSETEMKVVEDSGSFGKSVWHWHMPQKNFNALTGE